MSKLLGFVMFLLSAIPAVTCIIYYYRRLGTRRELLKQTLISMQLREAYMAARHGDITATERLSKFEESFKRDFRSGLSGKDYVWPVALATVISVIGWFLTFSRAYPSFTSVLGASSFLPAAFGYGFVGAFSAALLTVFDNFRTFNLEPNTYYSITYRMLFSSTAAYVVIAAGAFTGSFAPLVAFGIGLFPVEQTWKVITDKAAQAVGTASNEGETGAALASIQGLEDQRNRQKLVDVDISTVQALATGDPFWLFFQTTFPLRAIVDMMDKAILYLYIGDREKKDDKVKELRTHGINGVIELVALVELANKRAAYGAMGGTAAADPFFKDSNPNQLIEDLRKVLGQEPQELKAFMYNLYYDPQVRLLFDIWGKYLGAEAASSQAGTLQAPVPAVPQPGMTLVPPAVPALPAPVAPGVSAVPPPALAPQPGGAAAAASAGESKSTALKP